MFFLSVTFSFITDINTQQDLDDAKESATVGVL